MALFSLGRRSEPSLAKPYERRNNSEQLKESLSILKESAQDTQVSLLSLQKRNNVDMNSLEDFLSRQRLSVTGLPSSDDWETFMKKRINTDFNLFQNAIMGFESRFVDFTPEDRQARYDQLALRNERIKKDVENLNTYFNKIDNAETQPTMKAVDLKNIRPVVIGKMVEEGERPNKNIPVIIGAEFPVIEGVTATSTDLFEQLNSHVDSMKQDIQYFNDKENRASLFAYLGKEKAVQYVNQMRALQQDYRYVSDQYSQYKTLLDVSGNTPKMDALMTEMIDHVDIRVATLHKITRNYIEISQMPVVEGEFAYEVDKGRENFENAETEYTQNIEALTSLLEQDKFRVAIQVADDRLYEELYDGNDQIQLSALYRFANQKYLVAKDKLKAYDALSEKDRTEDDDQQLARSMGIATNTMYTETIPKIKNLISILHEASRKLEEMKASLVGEVVLTDYEMEEEIAYDVTGSEVARIGKMMEFEPLVSSQEGIAHIESIRTKIAQSKDNSAGENRQSV